MVAWTAIAGAARRVEGQDRFEFFTAAEAREVDAIAARIIPADETPGAREPASSTSSTVRCPRWATPFFLMVRMHTIMGFLAYPRYGGNRGRVGWKLIGFQGAHAYEPPFGFYDREA